MLSYARLDGTGRDGHDDGFEDIVNSNGASEEEDHPRERAGVGEDVRV